MHHNIHSQQGSSWPVVDYSLNRGTVTIPPNFDAGSIILNVAPSQTVQLLPAAAAASASSSSAQLVHQHQSPQPHQQQPQQQMQAANNVQSGTSHTMLSANAMGSNSGTMGQLLQSGMLVPNPHVTSSMIWPSSSHSSFSTQQQVHYQVIFFSFPIVYFVDFLIK